jgi:hypothetical protein
MALRAARSFLSAGKTVDETVDLVWRGLRASPVGDAANPWTEAQVREIVEDIAGREAPPLKDWPEFRVGDGPTFDGDGENGWFSPHSANGHHEAQTDDLGSESGDTDSDERGWTLDCVLETFHRWLYLPDDGVVLATLAAAAANYMHDDPDPCWLLVVGGSAGGKTEILMSLAGLRQVRVAASINVAGLLSGTPKRDREKGARGGLLMEIGRFGLLVLKDFTTIISQNRDARAETLAALREVYDGTVRAQRRRGWREDPGMVGQARRGGRGYGCHRHRSYGRRCAG